MTKQQATDGIVPASAASAPEAGAPSKDIPLTIDMVRAGVAAFERWEPETEMPQCIVTEVFYAMLGAI